MVFKLVREIKSKDGVLHFRRWRIFSIGNFSANIHAIYKADSDKHLHSHPWSFLNIVLKGRYTERLPGDKLNKRRPLNIALRKAEAYHKIESVQTPVVYTLNFMWGKRKEWGYDVDGKFVQHEEYRKLKNEGKL